jgi:hypothetical protein
MVGPRQTLLEQSIDLLNNALENGDCDVLVDIDPALFDPEYLTEESEALVERMLVSEYDCFRSWVWDNIEDTNITSIPVMFGTWIYGRISKIESHKISLWKILRSILLTSE